MRSRRRNRKLRYAHRVVMLKGPVITTAVALLAMTGVVAAFLTSASPYVTVAQARESSGNRLHLLGALEKGSIHADFKNHAMTFRLRDPKGEICTVRHIGEPPSNLAEAKEVVAIGSMEKGEFVSEQLLLKCPSKYEGDPKLGAVAKS